MHSSSHDWLSAPWSVPDKEQTGRRDIKKTFMKTIISMLAILLMALHPMNAQTKINVSVGGRNFAATLEDNATARAFLALLPANWQMTELNGNEKYVYLDTSLPTAAVRYQTIRAGDILLYGNNCVVVFYKTFQSGYSYTPIGHIDDAPALASAVDSGNVAMAFSLHATGLASVSRQAEHGTAAVYGVDGIRQVASKELKPGLYIQNGKKTIIK